MGGGVYFDYIATLVHLSPIASNFNPLTTLVHSAIAKFQVHEENFFIQPKKILLDSRVKIRVITHGSRGLPSCLVGI